MAQTLIDVCQQSDLPELQAMLRSQLEEELALFYKPSLLTHQKTSDETLIRLIEFWIQAPSVAVFVARVDGTVAGFISAQLKNDLYNDQDVISGEVVAIFSHSTYRKQGLGSALMAHVIEWFESNKAHAINVSWLVGNAASEALYKKFGFEPTVCYGRKITADQE